MFPNIFSRTKPGAESADAPGAHAGNQDGGRDVESFGSSAEGAAPQAQDSESVAPKGRSYLETLYPDDWSSRFECMGELIIERRADPSDVVQVYKTLNEVLEADIIYVNPTVRGMSIVCGIKELDSFIDSLPEMPRLASWALTHR